MKKMKLLSLGIATLFTAASLMLFTSCGDKAGTANTDDEPEADNSLPVSKSTYIEKMQSMASNGGYEITWNLDDSNSNSTNCTLGAKNNYQWIERDDEKYASKTESGQTYCRIYNNGTWQDWFSYEGMDYYYFVAQYAPLFQFGFMHEDILVKSSESATVASRPCTLYTFTTTQLEYGVDIAYKLYIDNELGITMKATWSISDGTETGCFEVTSFNTTNVLLPEGLTD